LPDLVIARSGFEFDPGVTLTYKSKVQYFMDSEFNKIKSLSYASRNKRIRTQ